MCAFISRAALIAGHPGWREAEAIALRCKGRSSAEQVRNGFMLGQQRYRCKACGLIVRDTPSRGMPLAHAPTPEPEGRAVVIELNGMWHFLKKVAQALDPEGWDRASGRLGARPS
jgi:hypothetical protein